jgi:hypothetical protein
VFQQIQYWGAQKGQTPDRIRRAIKRLEALDSRLLNLEDMIALWYILGRRVIDGEPAAIWIFVRADWRASSLWTALMPWEKQRAMRMLNLLTSVAERRLQEMRRTLEIDNEGNTDPRYRGLANYNWSPFVDGSSFATKPWAGGPNDDKEDWLHTTSPDMSPMEMAGSQTATYFARFEAQRRATLIVLAIEAYRVDHGELPKSLDELAPDYFAKVPLDPYSGLDFRYFPEGIPAPRDAAEKHAFDRSIGFGSDAPGFAFEFNHPVIWSTGPYLTQQPEVDDPPGKAKDALDQVSLVVAGYHLREYNGSFAILPPYTAWRLGAWFPVPDLGIGSHGPGDDVIGTGSSAQKGVAP